MLNYENATTRICENMKIRKMLNYENAKARNYEIMKIQKNTKLWKCENANLRN